MRKFRLFPITILSFALVIAAACGGDDGEGESTADATPGATFDATPGATFDATPGATFDAAPVATFDAAPMGSNPLGLPCTGMCPDNGQCTALTGVGSQTEGFCTIPCEGQMDTTTCAAGYTSPGTPGCVLTDQNQTMWNCGIRCETPGDSTGCPEGLGCFATGQEGFNLCAGDEGV